MISTLKTVNDMNLVKPQIASFLKAENDIMKLIKNALENDAEISGSLIKDALLEYEDMSYLSFSGCKFENCRFSESSFEKTSFTDCIFKGCDFSNCGGTDCYICRCEILSSKLIGANFSNSVFKEVLFRSCICTYAVFDGSSVRNVCTEGCDFSSAELSCCTLKGFAPSDSRFIGASFFKTMLKGTDFSDCQLEGIKISEGFPELKGAVVSPSQALELSALLGIKIKDD